MRIIGSLFLLSVISTNAFCEWESYGKVGIMEKFYDLDAITYDFEKDSWKTWYLLDLGEVQNVQDKIKYQSMVQQVEINCITKSRRQVYSGFLSEPMGKGKLVFEFKEPKEWIPLIPNKDDDMHWTAYESLCIDAKKEQPNR